MTTIYYDGSWEGLATAIFEVYEYKLNNVMIAKEDSSPQNSLFGDVHIVFTNTAKADRVKNGIIKKLGKTAWQELYWAFLSEKIDVELLILRVVQYYMASEKSACNSNYAHEDVLQLKQINKSVSRERHRFKAFVRFKLLKDGLYFAKIDPDFNILPLIVKHFKDRYSDQCWLIYDVRRGYGVYYDKSTITEVHFDSVPAEHQLKNSCQEDETLYDDLWKRYFKSTNIIERKNNKLHLQHVPKRYWKYLNEKF